MAAAPDYSTGVRACVRVCVCEAAQCLWDLTGHQHTEKTEALWGFQPAKAVTQ